MKRIVLPAIVAAFALSSIACTQQTAQQLNTAQANSPIYIGALTWQRHRKQAYDGKIRRFGLDLGATRPSHVIWHVYQLSGLVGGATSADPKVLAGNYGGENASISAGGTAGGNWLYGGRNNQIVLQATQLKASGDAGYNVAYGIAEISLTLKN